MYPDEAAEGVDAQRLISEPGFHPVFFDDDGGREALFAYIVSLSFRVFGVSVTTLRGTAAALGVTGVVLIWFALRRYGRLAAFAGMAWAAGSLWLIAVSRDGFRNILVVPAGALALWALLHWSERPARHSAAVAGAAMALGLWTYQPLKLLPLLVVLWMLWIRRTDRSRYDRLRPTLGWCIAAYVAVASPMIATAIIDSRNYFGRGAGVSVFNPESGSADSLPVHVLRTLGMFLVTGDPNQRHDVDALPLLGPVLCIPFALGLWRAWTQRRRAEHSLLLIGLGVFLIPPLVANEGLAPHFLRSLGLAPFVAGLLGIGFAELVRMAGAFRQRGLSRALAIGAGAAAAAVLGVMSTRAYLERPEAARYDAFSFATARLAAAARGPGTVAVVDDNNALAVRFLDSGDLPTIVEPGVRLLHPGVYTLVVAFSRPDLAAATDAVTAERAIPVAYDPSGQPAVWEAVP